jgi:hypothetical protein
VKPFRATATLLHLTTSVSVHTTHINTGPTPRRRHFEPNSLLPICPRGQRRSPREDSPHPAAHPKHLSAAYCRTQLPGPSSAAPSGPDGSCPGPGPGPKTLRASAPTRRTLTRHGEIRFAPLLHIRQIKEYSNEPCNSHPPTPPPRTVVTRLKLAVGVPLGVEKVSSRQRGPHRINRDARSNAACGRNAAAACPPSGPSAPSRGSPRARGCGRSAAPGPAATSHVTSL